MTVQVAGEDLGIWCLDDLTLGEAFMLKNTTGLAPAVMERGLSDGDPDSWRALVWFMRRRKDSDVTLESVDFKYGDLDFTPVEEVEDKNPPASGVDAPTPT